MVRLSVCHTQKGISHPSLVVDFVLVCMICVIYTVNENQTLVALNHQEGSTHVRFKANFIVNK